MSLRKTKLLWGGVGWAGVQIVVFTSSGKPQMMQAACNNGICIDCGPVQLELIMPSIVQPNCPLDSY